MDITREIDGAAEFGAETLKSKYKPTRWVLTSIREQPSRTENAMCDTPEKAAAYWRASIETVPGFNPEVETFYVLLLNTRRRIKGHVLVSTGTMDTLLVHAREVFRIAIIGSASAIILMHNHPSGDSHPSEPDIKITRDLIRAGQILKIEVLDHVIVGNPEHRSLRELGFFNSLAL
jgi:DNA repair protein RadC